MSSSKPPQTKNAVVEPVETTTNNNAVVEPVETTQDNKKKKVVAELVEASKQPLGDGLCTDTCIY